ncbi:MAG: hypothetical protein ACJA1N_000030 [Saprospiraceae bacterium]|jgi:hypothetical protein
MKISILKNLFALAMIFIVFSASAQNTIKTKDLEILLVTNYTHIYSDHGTGAGMNLSIWKQKPQSGFHSLGHYAQGSYATPQAVTVMVKGLTNRAVVQPTGFTRFYTDGGTGGDQDLALWTPIAPSGYMAMGLVATSGGQPSTAEVVCVRRDLVTLATAGKLIFNDGGSGGNQDLGLWRINPPSFPKDSKYSYITSGSFCGHASHSKPNNSNVTYALRVLIPADENNVQSQRPQLTGMNKPAEKTKLVLTSTSKLPCVSVNDAAYRGNAARQVRETPVYTLERYDYYQLQDFNTSTSPNDGTMTFEMKTGMEVSHEKSIEQTFETSVTAEAGVESGIYSASISVTVSYALSQSESFSKSEMKEETATKKFTVPGKGAGALYNLCHQYQLKRANGEVIETWVLSTKNSHFTDFAPGRKIETNTNSNVNSNTNTSTITNTNVSTNTANLWASTKWGGDHFKALMGDINGDGKADRVLYHQVEGNWYGLITGGTKPSWDSEKWGGNRYIGMVADINGDGKVDRIVYNPTNGDWGGKITGGGKTTWDATQWGSQNYTPMMADIDGDGKADRIVYNTVNGDWGCIPEKGGNVSWNATKWGGNDYVAMMADIDGDGKSDRIVYNTVTGDWGGIPAKGGASSWNGTKWGGTGYVARMADVDGDGKSDRILYNKTTGDWGIRLAVGGNLSWDGTQWGVGSFVPMMGDIDGNGKSDRVIYSETPGTWIYKLAD